MPDMPSNNNRTTSSTLNSDRKVRRKANSNFSSKPQNKPKDAKEENASHKAISAGLSSKPSKEASKKSKINKWWERRKKNKQANKGNPSQNTSNEIIIATNGDAKETPNSVSNVSMQESKSDREKQSNDSGEYLLSEYNNGVMNNNEYIAAITMMLLRRENPLILKTNPHTLRELKDISPIKLPAFKQDAKSEDHKKTEMHDISFPPFEKSRYFKGQIFKPAHTTHDLFYAIITLDYENVKKILGSLKEVGAKVPFPLNILAYTYQQDLNINKQFYSEEALNKARRKIARELASAGALTVPYDGLEEFKELMKDGIQLDSNLFSDMALLSTIAQDNDYELFRIVFITLPSIAFQAQLFLLAQAPFILGIEMTNLLELYDVMENKKITENFESNLAIALPFIKKTLGNDQLPVIRRCHAILEARNERLSNTENGTPQVKNENTYSAAIQRQQPASPNTVSVAGSGHLRPSNEFKF